MDNQKDIDREAERDKYRLTAGDIRRELDGLDNDCVVQFSTSTEEEFFHRVKVRGRESGSDKPTLVTFEMNTIETD